MDDIAYREEALTRRTPDAARLEAFGFLAEAGVPTFRTPIADGALTLTVTVRDGRFAFSLTDAIGEEYTLHRTSGAAGAFVGRVREEYTAILAQLEQCCVQAFSQGQTQEILVHAKAMWGDEPDCPFSDGGSTVLRRADNRKWYAIFMKIPRRKLGQGTDAAASAAADAAVTVVNLKMDPAAVPSLIDNAVYFPAYHMNKTHWITVVLDGSAPTAEICTHLETSHTLAGGKR